MTLIRVCSTIIYLEGKFASNKKQTNKQEQMKKKRTRENRISWAKQNLKAKEKCKPTKDSILITK